MTNSEIWMISLTAVIAVGGIIAATIFNSQLGVMSDQLTEMKTASKIAEKSLVAVQRAFVSPTVLLTPVRDSSNKLQFWRALIGLENSGATQTNKLRWTFTGGVDLTPDPEVNTISIAYGKDAPGGSGFLAPKGKVNIIDSIFNRTKMAEIIKGRGAYFLGRVDYEDIFGKSHTTKFCVHLYGGPWNTTLPDSALDALIDGFDLNFNMCRHNNCADDECSANDLG
ncbi:hypothetical protein [Methyloferula stellata]|uniref:hypothetical protein n=1 Tax=Methyloferula stellata TaxID=876270 RepID=UPI000371B1CD|nr:hypothetical protein [Methyloferula stellata]